MGWFDLTLSRRCIAVDLGQSRVKAILVERKGSRVEVLHAFNLDLQEEGLLTMEETDRHISRILLEMGEYPVSLVIPQHIAVSHLISLPSEGKGARWERMVEQETQKLTGLSDSAIVYDTFRLRPVGGNRSPVWVTVSRERELEEQIERLRGSGLMVSEVTNAGNALASAWLAAGPEEDRVVLADIGATATTVVVIENRQPIYATAFPIGGELFTESIAAARGIPFDEAESIKKAGEIFSDRENYPEFLDAVNRWREELRKVLAEAIKLPDDRDEEAPAVLLSGGSSLQPGFLDYLREDCVLNYRLWGDSTRGVDPQTYAVAYGAALAGLQIAPIQSSLLPRPLRQARFRMVQAAALRAIAAVLLIVLFIVLLLDASAKREGLRAREEMLHDLEEAYKQTANVEELLEQRNQQYRQILPIVQQQKRTRDLLRTLELMKQVRGKTESWFVLLADGESYEEGATVRAREESASSRAAGQLEPIEDAVAPRQWDRFIAEIAVPKNGGEGLAVLRTIVESFGQEDIYRRVDTLPPSERKQLAEEAVILPGQTFAINLQLRSGGLLLPPTGEPERSGLFLR